MLNPIKQMAVTVSDDHGAYCIDMMGTIDVDVGPGQLALGTNVTMRNQLLGMQSGLLLLRHDNVALRTAVNQIQLRLGQCFGILNGNVRKIVFATCETIRCSWGERCRRGRRGGTWKSC
jgi:hypothetical protein